MGLRDIQATLPPGFRFYPSDEELVFHYLYKKVVNDRVLKGTMVEVDLHTCEPWQLPEVAKLGANEWYFFSFRNHKYATGFRANRATTSGYWKATGKDRLVFDPTSHAIIGMRKTLVFYRNRAPNGINTGWVMHEFRLENPNLLPKENWVLCRVFHKSKEEHITKLDTTVAASSPNFHSSPLTIPSDYQQITSSSQIPHHEDHSPSSLLNLSVLNPNLLDFPHETTTAPIMECSSKADDENVFSLDMSLDEIRFEDENSIVFSDLDLKNRFYPFIDL
ncbi:hypothetical protein HHK36_022522 [Tetracentron sinense]|uniref:NAC domain-containing protein n=1 Tax=Tetracentron sinense TaxID=13715 RepID=A0A834YQ00_TETSI|nr:hypothetical protein HHK36_022522 [Tetracentron sinense]